MYYDINTIIDQIICRKSAFIYKSENDKIRKHDCFPGDFYNLHKNISKKGLFGIYPQFPDKSHPSNNNFHCGFIAIDVDLHGDLDSRENRQKTEETIKIIKSKAKDYFFVEEKYLYKEKTEHGYHIWLFFKDKILQKYVLQYIRIIRNNIENRFSQKVGHFFNELEFFPKGEVSGDGYGNAIFLHTHNRNEPLDGRINKIPVDKIKGIVKRANKLNYPSVRFRQQTNNRQNDPSQSTCQFLKNSIIKNRQQFGKTSFGEIDSAEELPILREYKNVMAPKKCIVHAINGDYKLQGSQGNTMRVRVVQEFANLGFSAEQIATAFSRQPDYNYEKSLYHTKQCIKHNYPFPRCKSIKKTGFCDPTCYKNGAFDDEEKPSYNSIEFDRNYPVIGWKDSDHEKPTLFEEVHSIIKDKEDYFINKTTRSGTTSAVIIEALKQSKKILMIAPTYRIVDKTVKKAIQIGIEDEHFSFSAGFSQFTPNIFKIKSNEKLCPRIEYGSEKMKNIFPFLLKPNCADCEYPDCNFRSFRENKEDYDIVFMTAQKLRVLFDLQSESEEARKLYNNLIQWCDFVFIDECYDLIKMNVNQMKIFDSNIDTIYKIRKSMKHYKKIMNNEFIFDFRKFLRKLEEKCDYFLNECNEPQFVKIEKTWFDVFFEKPGKWSKQYAVFIDFFKKHKNIQIRNIVKFFLALSCKHLYLQLRITREGEKEIYLASVEDIPHFIQSLKRIRKKKIVTDAVKPPIKMAKIWRDMKVCNINDPMKTAEKQTIVHVSNHDPFFVFADPTISDYSKDRLVEEINKIGELKKNKPIFVVTQSKKYKNKLSYLLENDKLTEIRENIQENTYHRSDKTIGVSSDIRQMICIGSSHPPRHVCDIEALMYIRLGLIEAKESQYEIIGKYLENYNAMSAFFQTISRVKDPLGKEKSKVYIFGMKFSEIRKWLEELKIAVPNLKKINL